MAEVSRDDPNSSHHVYCYCVVSGEVTLHPDPPGGLVGALPPYLVRIGELQAVASRVPATGYDEEALRANLHRMEWVGSAVLGHERVVEECLGQTEVVPMKFCTVFRSESDLVDALGSRREELAAKLLDLNGKREWGIRLMADPERLRRHLLETTPELVNLRDGVASKSAGAAYLLRKRLEERLARTVERARAEAAEDAYRELAAIATRGVLLKAWRPAAGDGDGVLNAAFLVTDRQLGQLLERVEGIVSERPWLRCEPTGPWPPYNFV